MRVSVNLNSLKCKCLCLLEQQYEEMKSLLGFLGYACYILYIDPFHISWVSNLCMVSVFAACVFHTLCVHCHQPVILLFV